MYQIMVYGDKTNLMDENVRAKEKIKGPLLGGIKMSV